MAETITTISIDLLEDADNGKFVTAQYLLLAAFRLVDYFYSQRVLIKAYYDLDPDCMERRKKSDPVRKYAPAYARDKDD